MSRLATLESTRGRRTTLQEQRGRVAVVFYEARGHTRDNEMLKQACGRLVERGTLGGRLVVLGVADLAGLGAPPVRALVKRAVRAVASSYGTELWMDFDGALSRPPHELPGGGSAVAILDARGEVVHRARGPLDVKEVERFFAALQDALQDLGGPPFDVSSAA